MNVDKLTEIAEWLEAGAPERKGVTGFDMEQFVQDRGCGTACCIAGAAVQFERRIPYANQHEAYCDGDPEDFAVHILGLTSDQGDALFYGRGVEIEDIDAAWAARCVRKLVVTGEVDWAGTEVFE